MSGSAPSSPTRADLAVSGVELVEGRPFSPGSPDGSTGWDPAASGLTLVTCGTDTVTWFRAGDAADPDPGSLPSRPSWNDSPAPCPTTAPPRRGAVAHIGTRDAVRDLGPPPGARRRTDRTSGSGTQIGQMCGGAFPAGIRTMVLDDGVVDPSKGFTEFLMGQIDGFDAAFDGAARCSAPVSGLLASGTTTRRPTTGCGTGRTGTPCERTPHPIGPAEARHCGDLHRLPDRRMATLGPRWPRRSTAAAPPCSPCPTPTTTSWLRHYAAGVVCTDTPPPPDAVGVEDVADRARAHFPGSAARSPTSCCRARPGRSAPTSSLPRSPLRRPHPRIRRRNTGDPAGPLSGPAPSLDAALGRAHHRRHRGPTPPTASQPLRHRPDRRVPDLRVAPPTRPGAVRRTGRDPEPAPGFARPDVDRTIDTSERPTGGGCSPASTETRREATRVQPGHHPRDGGPQPSAIWRPHRHPSCRRQRGGGAATPR